jgi:hypothetical protein
MPDRFLILQVLALGLSIGYTIMIVVGLQYVIKQSLTSVETIVWALVVIFVPLGFLAPYFVIPRLKGKR